MNKKVLKTKIKKIYLFKVNQISIINNFCISIY